MRVLVIEDDTELRLLVARGLRKAGVSVDTAADLAEADLALAVNAYDCVVADRNLPDGDAMVMVPALRERGVTVPVLLLTARGSLEDRVAGFEHGADDYVTKPFAMSELVLRVRALARRAEPPRSPVLQSGSLRLDTARRRVTRDGVLLSLTAKEFSVLAVLAERPDVVVSRSELIERCWDETTEPMSNVVDVIVAQLRRRLGGPEVIETVRGAGYRLIGDA